MSLNVRIAALAASASVLAAVAFAPAASAAGVMPRIDVKPGVVRLAVKAQPGPFTTAQCEKTLGIPCYQPAQIRTAYNLQALYWYGDQGPTPLASGGGTSVMFSRPAWQNGVSAIVGSHRGVPDISMNAACSAPVNIYGTFGGQLQPGWSLVCGTSEATPEFAAIVALADQVAGKPLGLINPALYQLSARHAPGIIDVTSGNNTVSFFQGTQGAQGTQGTPNERYTVTGFAARRGYDLATGVGTINAPLFVHELAGR